MHLCTNVSHAALDHSLCIRIRHSIILRGAVVDIGKFKFLVERDIVVLLFFGGAIASR